MSAEHRRWFEGWRGGYVPDMRDPLTQQTRRVLDEAERHMLERRDDIASEGGPLDPRLGPINETLRAFAKARAIERARERRARFEQLATRVGVWLFYGAIAAALALIAWRAR